MTEIYGEGQILLQDDGWFEGIVVDPSSSYTEDRFIFDVYYLEKVVVRPFKGH